MKLTSYIKTLICLILLAIPSAGYAKTLRIALMPWKVNSSEEMEFVKNAVADMLSSRLGSKETIEIIRPEAVKEALGEKKALNESSAIEAGKKLKADYVLSGSLTVIGAAVSMDASLVNVATAVSTPLYSKASGLASVVGLIDQLSEDVLVATGLKQPVAPPLPKAEAKETLAAKNEAKDVAHRPEAESYIVKPTEDAKRPVLWKSAPIEGLFKAAVSADLDNDDVKEIVLLSGKSIIIARRDGDALKSVKELKESGHGEFFAASVIDADNDGVEELYISRIEDERASGLSIEFREGDYRVVSKDIPFMMRTVDGEKGPVLIGQRFRKSDGIYGPLVALEKKGGAVNEKGIYPVALPRRADIYRFDSIDLTGDGVAELLTLDDRGYLHIYKKGVNEKWEETAKSVDWFGGTLNYVRFGSDQPGVAEAEPVSIEGRFFHADLNNDGKAEVVIKKNTPGGLGRSAERASSYKSGEVVSLSWDEKAMSLVAENWRTKEIGGYVSDFFVGDLDKDGSPEVVLLVVEGTEKLFGTPKSYILSLRLSI
ncbi:MAG: VCBS repeat-containing protein [Deltaproteobacteria bacterium]|nr:VCBS repeat-containing protein [Deltaproteobacteria bacterium]